MPAAICIALRAMASASMSSRSIRARAAAIIALFTVATRRRWRDVGAVWVLYVAGVAAFYLMRPEPGLPLIAVVALCLVVTAAVVAWGMYLRARKTGSRPPAPEYWIAAQSP